jgi:hypothetical protein
MLSSGIGRDSASLGTRVRVRARNRILEEATAVVFGTRTSKKTRNETVNALRCEGEASCGERSGLALSNVLQMALISIPVPSLKRYPLRPVSAQFFVPDTRVR